MGGSVWQHIVDVSSDQIYNFPVQTNFNYINLQSIEHKHEDGKDVAKTDMAKVRANNLLSEYVTTSFMSANEKFNSAMVFET